MAAGISLKEENIQILHKKLNENCTLTEEDLAEKVVIDMMMPIAYISRRLIQQIDLLEPFGAGNKKPLFVQKNLNVSRVRILGKNRNVAKTQVVDEHGYAMDALYFGDVEKFQEYAAGHRRMMLTYYPTINSYMGRETLQITIQNYR